MAVLRPLAEGPAVDPAAQFFMAVLYLSGQGVERNQLRACALFASAAKPSNPFMLQSSAIASTLRDEMGLGASFCTDGGLWRDPAPASFVLGPNHRVDITASSITVRYNGTERRVMTSGLPGMVYVPIRYTPLEVTRPVAARRHFLQTFVWQADVPETPSVWTLGWILAEVVGADMVPVTGERSLVTVPGGQPPASFDVEKLAHVRVGANGDVEWEITGSADPRRGIVPWRDPR